MEEEGHIEMSQIQRNDSKGIQDGNEAFKRVVPWRKQITVRGIFVSMLIGIIYSFIIMKLNLTTGIVPNFNVSAALLAFVFIKTWAKLLEKGGFVSAPFTPQENTIIQTCAVACYGIANGGGFGSYLLGLNKRTYEMTGADIEGNVGYKELTIGRITGFLFLVSFAGLFALVPLRKVLIIDYKLAYPSGKATATLINNFHTPKGDKLAKKQVHGFAKSFFASFFWACFQWFYSGAAGTCGFSHFPTFGLAALKQTFNFDFSTTYIGAGMMCSHLVNLSLLFGAVLSWGVMWPLINKQKGDWYHSAIPESSMKSLSGYKVFITISLLLGDGLYNLLKILYFTIQDFSTRMKNRNPRTCIFLNLYYLSPPIILYQYQLKDGFSDPENNDHPIDQVRRNEVFISEHIPLWAACVGYLSLSLVSIVVIPILFPELKWYFVLAAYVLAPCLSFCNAYGAGLTDMNMAYNYGKVALFIIASVSGKNTGVIAGLVGCGVIKFFVIISSDLMQDFKTGHLTLTSPRSMLVSQIIGAVIGCVVSPLVFYLFYHTYDIGNPDGEYKAPFAIVYRNLAIIAVEGFSALPCHCLELCYGFFGFAVLANFTRDVGPSKIARWIPLPMAMAVPFLVGGNFAIDMCFGSLLVYVWNKINKIEAGLMIPAVASGLICGDGLWILPSSMLGLAKIHPPICMKFSKDS